MDLNVKHAPKKTGSWWYNIGQICLVCIIAFVIRSFGYGLYRVPTGSMETTMLVGELFFANKFIYAVATPKHGDIVAFNDPSFKYTQNRSMQLFEYYVWGPENWSKRVIGVPGDQIKGAVEHGRAAVYCNGKKIDEYYLDITNSATDGRGVNNFYIELGTNQYWVMGDNRCNSHDSRFFGPLDGSLIHGKIVYRLASIDRNVEWMLLDMIVHPIAWWQSIRWQRCMEAVI